MVTPEVLDVKQVQVENNDEASEEEPKYGPLRRLSQKKEQLFLNYPAAFSLAMILLTLIKLFVQIFDIYTDTVISNDYFPFASQKMSCF